MNKFCYNRAMKKIALTILLFLVAVLSCQAETPDNDPPKLYQVEIIVFENLNNKSINSEVWPNYPALPSINNAIELQPREEDSLIDNFLFADSLSNEEQVDDQDISPEVIPYQMLPETAFTLRKEEQALQKNNQFIVLLHTAWLQEIHKTSESESIHIYAGDLNDEESGSIFEEPSYNSQKNWRIDGSITLIKLNYFHLKANLILNIPVDRLKLESWIYSML